MARLAIIALGALATAATLCEALVVPTIITANPPIPIHTVPITQNASSTTPTPTIKPSTSTSTSSSVASLPSGVFCDLVMRSAPILAITHGTAVTGLELASSGGSATLQADGYQQGWSFANGGVGVFDQCHYIWLNIGESAHSYKPLSFALDDQVTTTWSGGSTSPLVANATAGYKATSTFLACEASAASAAGQWTLYLQTGSDVPAGEVCADTQLQLGASTTLPIA